MKTLVIDPVGLFYACQCNICEECGELIAHIASEMRRYSRIVFVDDGKIQKYMGRIAEILPLYLSSDALVEVTAVRCDLACARYHEVYHYICQCRQDEDLLLAMCCCGKFAEGVNCRSGGREVGCFVHLSCKDVRRYCSPPLSSLMCASKR